ncbi:hypothetical protein QAD02_011406 [Eretmocerus hayati]|uniref:Uncharacterized protein n=1 Tax=Eretmocerus hayati TaxID=131215 RepID=A0ACC2NWN8_9HYME|nr:hypothetical protein QAD02_011406 [Eretmocerus hayati]
MAKPGSSRQNRQNGSSSLSGALPASPLPAKTGRRITPRRSAVTSPAFPPTAEIRPPHCTAEERRATPALPPAAEIRPPYYTPQERRGISSATFSPLESGRRATFRRSTVTVSALPPAKARPLQYPPDEGAALYQPANPAATSQPRLDRDRDWSAARRKP